MPVRVLGCSGAIAAGSRTTSFLVDDDLLVDAGTGVGDLSLAELERIDHILVTHAHLDHIVSIGLMADAVMASRAQRGRPPIEVHALPETLAALRQHVFNNLIWPDFTQLPSAQAPVLALKELAHGSQWCVGGRRIEVLPAEHTVPACGYAVWGNEWGEGPAWVFTGDTGPNPALWRRLAHLDIGHLIIETAFGNDDCVLAEKSRHLCPRQLLQELSALKPGPKVWITHIKPGQVPAVMRQILEGPLQHAVAPLGTGQVMALRAGEAG